MRSNYDYLAQNGFLGRELTDQEIADNDLEGELQDQEYFSSPAYLRGQLAAALAEWAEAF